MLLAAAHTLYTVTLAPALPTGFAGQVRFEPSPGCWALFVTAPATLEAHTPSGKPRPWTAAAPVSACGELATAYTMAFDQGEGAVLSVRGSSAEEIGLLVERVSAGPEAVGAGDGTTGDGAGVDGGNAALADAPSETATAEGEADGRVLEEPDGLVADAGALEAPGQEVGPPPACRSSGSCTRNDECCDYCHDGDHCH